MALEGVKGEKNEENGNLPDGKANGIDNKSKQVIWRSGGSDIITPQKLQTTGAWTTDHSVGDASARKLRPSRTVKRRAIELLLNKSQRLRVAQSQQV